MTVEESNTLRIFERRIVRKIYRPRKMENAAVQE
jgi:hypothetical protein